LKIDQRAADLTANQYVSFARTRSTDAQRQSFADLDADCELAWKRCRPHNRLRQQYPDAIPNWEWSPRASTVLQTRSWTAAP